MVSYTVCIFGIGGWLHANTRGYFRIVDTSYNPRTKKGVAQIKKWIRGNEVIFEGSQHCNDYPGGSYGYKKPLEKVISEFLSYKG